MSDVPKNTRRGLFALCDGFLDLFNPLGMYLKPIPPLPKGMTTAEITAEAWQMIGDSLRSAMETFESTYMSPKRDSND